MRIFQECKKECSEGEKAVKKIEIGEGDQKGIIAGVDCSSAGKGFVAFHAATDSFHSPAEQRANTAIVDPYIAMVGGEFVSHGPQQQARMTLVSRFPGTPTELEIGKSDSLLEEWYASKNFAPDLHVIFVLETDGMQGDDYQRPNFPATWARRHGKGRVFGPIRFSAQRPSSMAW